MDEVLPAIEVETAENPQFTVIWMHGLGADGSDFEFMVWWWLGAVAGRGRWSRGVDRLGIQLR